MMLDLPTPEEDEWKRGLTAVSNDEDFEEGVVVDFTLVVDWHHFVRQLLNLLENRWIH